MIPGTLSGGQHRGQHNAAVGYRLQFAQSWRTVSTTSMSELDLLTEGPAAGPTIALAHGAGAAMDSDWMNDISAALASRGLRVVRFEFPYMQRRREDGKRRGPDRPPVLLATWRAIAETLAGAGTLVIGGREVTRTRAAISRWRSPSACSNASRTPSGTSLT